MTIRTSGPEAQGTLAMGHIRDLAPIELRLSKAPQPRDRRDREGRHGKGSRDEGKRGREKRDLSEQIGRYLDSLDFSDEYNSHRLGRKTCEDIAYRTAISPNYTQASMADAEERLAREEGCSEPIPSILDTGVVPVRLANPSISILVWEVDENGTPYQAGVSGESMQDGVQTPPQGVTERDAGLRSVYEQSGGARARASRAVSSVSSGVVSTGGILGSIGKPTEAWPSLSAYCDSLSLPPLDGCVERAPSDPQTSMLSLALSEHTPLKGRGGYATLVGGALAMTGSVRPAVPRHPCMLPILGLSLYSKGERETGRDGTDRKGEGEREGHVRTGSMDGGSRGPGKRRKYLVSLSNKDSLAGVIRYSALTLADTDKQQFLVYQILHTLASLHSAGVTHGRLCLSTTAVFANAWRLRFGIPTFSRGIRPLPTLLRQRQRQGERDCLQGQRILHQGATIRVTESVTARWVYGEVSNLGYLLWLNRLCGRQPTNLFFPPVLPWVVDFSQDTLATGEGWRDLTQSKFLMKKGHEQLAFTFETQFVSFHTENLSIDSAKVTKPLHSVLEKCAVLGQAPEATPPHVTGDPPLDALYPHHIVEYLSELSILTLLARRVPIKLITLLIRPKFETREFPDSLKRVYGWTPEECVLEYYTSPDAFTAMEGTATEELLRHYVKAQVPASGLDSDDDEGERDSAGDDAEPGGRRYATVEEAMCDIGISADELDEQCALPST
eukprot:g7779.t1